MKTLLRILLLPLVSTVNTTHAQTAEGERLFKQRCAMCHSLEQGKHLAGPSLAGVMNQSSARYDKARYSEALKQSGLVWDEKTLDAFLADPSKLVPGTRMMVRITQPQQRSAIIQYLATQNTSTQNLSNKAATP
ncbi:Cytochrome c2 iso-2 [Thalassocella blandensis]|nr:Cytochrome c2 iso-2 [Thalassocella blandensis]